MTGPGVVEYVAMHGSGMAARLAARSLCRRLRTGNPHREVHSIVRLLCSARDERVKDLARTALERAWEQVLDGRSSVWYGLRRHAESIGAHGMADMPAAAARFLLAPVSASRFSPPVRVVAALGVKRGERLEHGGTLLIEAAVHSTDPQTREGLGDLLRRTDHPALLDGLGRAFGAALHGHGTAPLWDDDRPTALLDILLGNPHLQRPPPPKGSMGIQQSELAVLAILQERLDLLRHYDQDQLAAELLRVLTMKHPLPTAIAERCRQVLLEFGPGRGREYLCHWAMAGNVAARAIVVEAGHLPAQSKHVPLFLYCTEQWERFDRIDPGGKQLRKHRDSYTHDDWHRLETIARRTGRPCPPRPTPAPITESQPSRYRPGGTGTSGTGGYTAGGGFGI